MNRIVSAFALLASAGFCADLPVTQVTLYKNGIGYFVRSGELGAGDPGRLSFKAGEMNDILKSLSIVEQGGGKVAGVRYESSEPLALKLSGFPFAVGAGQPLVALLDQLRGSHAELKTGPASVSGVIVGAREVAGSDNHPQRQELTLLADSGDLRTVDLGSVGGIQFSDAVLQGQLKEYLSTVAAGRSQDRRNVVIDSTGLKARCLTASYVVPTPVWKSSYRLVFTEAPEPMLEGWAIVDNTTGEDWTNVKLALVSGRPVSFVSRLFEPRYLARPAAELPEDRAEAPELYGAAVGGGRRFERSDGGVLGGIVNAAPAAAAPPPEMRALNKATRDLRASVDAAEPMGASSIALSTRAGDVGELFEYGFGTPVTVRTGQSAMLPFVQQRIAARKLLVYSTAGSEHPRNAAEITNSSGKTLDGGPITVFDGNAYGGEALVETVKAGDKRLISYAVDLGTRITTRLDSSRNFVRELHARRGVLTLRSAAEETTVYTIRNVDAKPKTLVIEHAIRPEYKLLKAKPAETTASAYRFEVKLAANADEKFPVAEERVYEQTVALASATPDILISYVENKNLSDAGRQQLERIAKQKSLIAENDGASRRAEEQINEIVRDQDRLRQNIMSLNRVTGQEEQVGGYAGQLATQETELASLRDVQSNLRKKKAELGVELNKLIETSEF